MNTPPSPRTSLIAVGVAFALLAACSVARAKPDGPESLANRAPPAMSEAEIAAIDAAEHSPAEAEISERGREIEATRDASADARHNAQELRARLDELHAEVTDHGIVLTLGDVLFASNTAALRAGSDYRLDTLVAFLKKYPERNALIEGYTDSMGSNEYNQALSVRRADAVKAYLIRQGVASSRLSASGNGETSPLGDNGSAASRRQNRRVQVIIED